MNSEQRTFWTHNLAELSAGVENQLWSDLPPQLTEIALKGCVTVSPSHQGEPKEVKKVASAVPEWVRQLDEALSRYVKDVRDEKVTIARRMSISPDKLVQYRIFPPHETATCENYPHVEFDTNVVSLGIFTDIADDRAQIGSLFLLNLAAKVRESGDIKANDLDQVSLGDSCVFGVVVMNNDHDDMLPVYFAKDLESGEVACGAVDDPTQATEIMMELGGKFKSSVTRHC